MYKVGYTQGVFDMFHVGHLRLLKKAKEYCDTLIVGVNSDKLVESYKNKIPVVAEKERAEIIENIKSVDRCIIVDTLDKVEIYQQIKFDVVFIGDDWKGNARWEKTERDLKKCNGIEVIYLPHTPNVSSTILREEKKNSIEEID